MPKSVLADIRSCGQLRLMYKTALVGSGLRHMQWHSLGMYTLRVCQSSQQRERDCGGWHQDTVADQSSHHIGPGPKFGCCVVQRLSSPIAAGCLSE